MAVTKFENAVVDNPVEAAFEALKAGKPVDEAVYGKQIDGPAEGALPPVEPDSSPLDSFLDDSEENSEVTEAPEDSAKLEVSENQESSEAAIEPSDILGDSGTPSEGSSPDLSDIEEFFVKGENGRKQKLKVDYGDRKAIKQAFLKASGMRKYQKERDNALKSIKDLESKYESISNDFSKLEKIFETGGVKGLVEQLGGEGAWGKAVESELKHREYLDNLTPNEKYQYDLQERETKYQKMLEAEKSKREEFERRIQEREEQAAMRDMEAKLHPSFDRYRFAGKLGDDVTEHQFDSAIWSTVTKRLQEYPDEIELTKGIIDKEFRTVANNFRKHINKQAEKKVKSNIESKKAEAGKRVQIAAKKGLSGNADNSKFINDIKSGNTLDSLKAVLSGKIKFR